MITHSTTTAEARERGQRLGEEDARFVVTRHLEDPSVDMVAFSAARLARLRADLQLMHSRGVPVDLIEVFGEASTEAYLAWTSTLLEQAKQGASTLQ